MIISDEYSLCGWDFIHKNLCFAVDAQGNPRPVMSIATLRKHKSELEKAKALFTIHIGPLRRPRICVWPSRARAVLFGIKPPYFDPTREKFVRGWGAIWKRLFHVRISDDKLLPIFCRDMLIRRWRDNLLECRCIFIWKEGSLGKKVYLCIPSITRLWITIAAQQGEI